MENLPVEVIGIILSHVAAARDVVIASSTCRKWREAARHHLRKLSFNNQDWAVYSTLTVGQCEVLITETILQTNGLHELSICMGSAIEFSAAPIIAWLMYTRDTLRSLTYMIQTKPNVNILEKCGRQKLEVLVWGFAWIPTVDPTIQRFPSLLSLTLNQAGVSALGLNLLLSACPKLESLSLVNSNITFSDAQSTMELYSASLKSFIAEGLSVDNIVLEADKLESLVLKGSTFEHFELVSKGSLRYLRIDDVSIIQLDIEEEVMDVETIAVSFPCLSRLALNYDSEDGLYRHVLRGSSLLEKVVVLELGASKIQDLFAQWISGFLERCPNLKRLVVHGEVSEAKSREDCQMIGRFTAFMVDLMRKFSHVDVKFEFF